VSSFLAHGPSVFFGAHDDGNPGVLLVPDGVARVTLGPAQPLPFETPHGVNPNELSNVIASVNATATVHDNIAAFDIRIPAISSPQASSGLYGISSTAPTTWYAAGGAIIRRTTTEVDLLVRIRGRANPVSARQIALAHRVSLVNIEPDLMCVACHKPLELADTPQAVDERAYISWLIAKGETKAQVENNLVRQYGPTVLTKNRTRR
jgi:hypothetical protein